MSARARAPARPLPLFAAALVAAAACHHENPSAPEEVLHAIDVSARALATAENGPPVAFEVVLRSRPSAPVEVEVRSEDATEGLVLAPGYALPAAVREVSFTPKDWDVPRQVAVHPVDDDVADGPTSYAVTLRVTYTEDPAYASVPALAVAMRNADDEAAGLWLDPAGPLTTSEDGAGATFLLSLVPPPPGPVVVRVTSGAPSEGLLLAPGSEAPQPSVDVTFTAAEWSRTIAVVGQRDGVPDGDQSYVITVAVVQGDPGSLSLPAREITVTNLDSGVVFTSADVPRALPDLATVASFLTVTNGPQTIRSITASVTLTHTFDGDLVLDLVSPSGTVVTLAARRGGAGDGFAGTTFDDGALTPIGAGTAPFPGSYRPETPLAALAGENANGAWTLRIRDAASGDSGTLLAWSVAVR